MSALAWGLIVVAVGLVWVLAAGVALGLHHQRHGTTALDRERRRRGGEPGES